MQKDFFVNDAAGGQQKNKMNYANDVKKSLKTFIQNKRI
jgi:hypothetical protein